MNRFEFQRIGRKELAITGEITIYKTSYEWLTDSKGNSHYVMVDETPKHLVFNVDDLTETLKIDELNFIGEPFSDWILHYPKLEWGWICENLYTSSDSKSKSLRVHSLRFIAEIMTEWNQYGVTLNWHISSRTYLEDYVESNGKYLEFPIYQYCPNHYAVGLEIDVERFFAYMWNNESLKKWLREKESIKSPKMAKIYDYQTAEEAAIQLLNIKAKQIKNYGRKRNFYTSLARC